MRPLAEGGIAGMKPSAILLHRNQAQCFMELHQVNNVHALANYVHSKSCL
jgi:hypothetical protein